MAFNEDEMAYLQSIFDAFEADPAQANDWERSFMVNNTERFQEYGNDMHLSEKQWVVIRKIGEIYKVYEPGSEAEKIKEQAEGMKPVTDVDDDEIPF